MSDIPMIKSTEVFSRLSAFHPSIEVWPDIEFSNDGYAYYWLVAHSDGAIRILSYVRCKGGGCEQRTYDVEGDDLWIPAGTAVG
ncbi:hypothetical protein [Pseudomonas marginalis]|uniref:Uncharacterized protein n=2 Tax=Pseudomonas marginalis TaxID=298 RepID=A0A3M4AVH4_PSEMA|nr:hypothetical protein [Pseudomonas marginalis]OAJ48472.1 hypothetical protein AO064_29810 [Pseudomonas marginalis]RMP10943.1 hypothetical protein ALQ29_00928 [Pseudomonas marginalis pv. marginalis]